MEAFALVIILLSGYRFSTHFKLTKFKTNRTDGQRLYLNSVFWGSALFLCSLIVMSLLGSLKLINFEYLIVSVSNQFYLGNDQDNKYKVSLLGLSLFAYLLAILLPFILNKIYLQFAFVVSYTSDEFDNIILRSFTLDLPVLIITSNDFVVVGTPEDSFGPERTDKSEITISPEYLGYLEDNKLVVLRSEYKASDLISLYDNDKDLMSDALKVVIPKHQIISLSLFDVDVYNKLKESQAIDAASDNLPSNRKTTKAKEQ